ncbi:MAG: hypothetical protein EXR47_01160 [Dehalococcoidia bacterium]|nr:hypothetical protein [Dehalococcoidia bacterium]
MSRKRAVQSLVDAVDFNAGETTAVITAVLVVNPELSVRIQLGCEEWITPHVVDPFLVDDSLAGDMPDACGEQISFNKM